MVYVDYDPVVCAHGRALLERSEGVAVVQADIRRPDEIVNSAEVRSLINFDEPVAVPLPRPFRGRATVHQLFDGFDLVDPGVVWLAEWGATEPVDQPELSLAYAALGRKP